MVDIESDGPIPGDYSMVCFGFLDLSSLLDAVAEVASASLIGLVKRS